MPFDRMPDRLPDPHGIQVLLDKGTITLSEARGLLGLDPHFMCYTPAPLDAQQDTAKVSEQLAEDSPSPTPDPVNPSKPKRSHRDCLPRLTQDWVAAHAVFESSRLAYETATQRLMDRIYRCP